MKTIGTAAAVVLATWMFMAPAEAALVVSNDATSNVLCSAGTCAASAGNAVLNASELESMLAGSAVTLKPGATAGDIVFNTSVNWSSTSALTLDAYRSIFIRHSLNDKGAGPLTLTINDGGAKGKLTFDRIGHIKISKVNTSLTINGNTYRLAKSIAQLASNIAAAPQGFHALANDYDARADGSYMNVPIPTEFSGMFEGLGNTISNLSYFGSTDQEIGLFKALVGTGTLRDIRMANVNLWSLQSFFQIMGGLVAYSEGHVTQCSATGKIRSDFFMTGGGLVGENYGTVDNSFADVDVEGAEDATVGGLMGNSHGTVENVYATGNVSAGDDSDVGGLIGYFIGDQLRAAYSTGTVSGGARSRVGGFLGENQVWASEGKVSKTYWDTVQSQTERGVGGTTGKSPGTKGVTTAKLQAGLPEGFKPGIWNERAGYSNGLPFLDANRP